MGLNAVLVNNIYQYMCFCALKKKVMQVWNFNLKVPCKKMVSRRLLYGSAQKHNFCAY